MNEMLKLRKDLTFKECGRQVRNVYDSLIEKHDWMMDNGHDVWAVCPCTVAEVIRAQAKCLDPTAGWVSAKGNK